MAEQTARREWLRFVIRSILLQVGFTSADLEEGWSLLRDACFVSAESDDEPSLDEAAVALRNLYARDERGFVLVQALSPIAIQAKCKRCTQPIPQPASAVPGAP